MSHQSESTTATNHLYARAAHDNPGTVESEIVSLPQDFAKCPLNDLIKIMSRMISSVIYINDSKMNSSEPMGKETMHSGSANCQPIALTRFHSKVPPNVSVYDYLVRLTKFSGLDQTVLLATLYYIDALSTVYPSFNINSLTVHRFLLAATTVACKGLRDIFYNNDHYAKVGGVLTTELNILESDFLNKLHYRILPRDANIFLMTQEQKLKQFIVFPSEVGQSAVRNNNAGYNVLTSYYCRMIGLVGNYHNIVNTHSSSTDTPFQVQKTLPAQNINYRVNANFKTSYKIETEREHPIIPSVKIQGNEPPGHIAVEENSQTKDSPSPKADPGREECKKLETPTEDYSNQRTPNLNRKRTLNTVALPKSFPSKKISNVTFNEAAGK